MRPFLKNIFFFSAIVIALFACNGNENTGPLKEMSRPKDVSISSQMELADSLMSQAKFDSSNKILKIISNKSKKTKNWKLYLESQNKMAGNYSDLGKYDSMKIALNHVFNFAKKYIDSTNLYTAQANYIFGAYYIDQSKFDSAKIYLNKSLEARKKLLPDNSPEIGNVYNSLGNIEFYTNNNQKALSYYKLAKELLLNRGFYNKKLGLVYMNIGITYNNLYQFEKAKTYLDTSLQIQKQILPSNHPILAQLEINKMSTFANSGDLDSAIIAGKKAMEIISGKFGSNHPYNGMIYNNLGMCYSSYGDDENALLYFEKAKNILESNKSNIYNQLSKCYVLLGNLNLNRKNYMQATKYFENALQLMKSENSNNVYESSQYKKLLAVSYAKLGKKNEAVQKINEAINDWRNSKNKNQMELAKTEVFLAEVFNIIRKYEQSQKIAKKSIKYFKTTTNINYLFFSYALLAESYLHQKAYKNVLDIYKKIFDYFPPVKTNRLINVKKIISYFELEEHIISLLSSSGKAVYHLFEQNRNPEYLNISEDISEMLSEIFFENYEKIITQASKFTESKRYKDQISIAMQLAFYKFNTSPDINNFEHALKLAEFSKSISLLESLNQKSALSKLSIPKNDLEKFQKINSSLIFYQRSLASDDAEQADSMEIKYYKGRLFELRNEYENYKFQLTKKYPKLNSLLKLNFSISVDSIRKTLLDKNQTAIEFYLYDNELYVFGISQNDFFILRKDIGHEMKDDINALLNSINNLNKTEYIHFASKIYNNIFSEAQKRINTTRVLIIPDGELGFIPFDALLYELPDINADYRDLPYLMKKYAIGYAYSFNILKEIKGGNKIVSNFIGLAPFSKN